MAADPAQPVGAEAALWAAVGVTGFKRGDRVPPGATFTYTWQTIGWQTTAGVWLYHDHSICDMENVQLGAIGIVVIHNPNDPEDVIVGPNDFPVANDPNSSPIRLRCFPFPFEVAVLPHQLIDVGRVARVEDLLIDQPGLPPMVMPDMPMGGDMPAMAGAAELMALAARRRAPAARNLRPMAVDALPAVEASAAKRAGYPGHRDVPADERVALDRAFVKDGLVFELNKNLTAIQQLCFRNYRTPPVKAQYLLLFHNLTGYWLAGTPPWFYLVFAAVKLSPLTVVTAACGLALAIWQRRPSHRLLLSWIGVWFLILSIAGSKWGRFFTSVLPAFLLLSGYFAAQVLNWWSSHRASVRVPDGGSLAAGRFPSLAAVAMVTLLLWGAEVQASLRMSPDYRMYINAFGGGNRNVDWFFPHCDYFDAGFREAMAYTAAHAEPDAELSTEIDWVARYYAGRFGRPDLVQSLVRRGESCRTGRTCYVVVQTGRYYFINKEAVDNLRRLEPWHVETIRGHEVVRVYRLSPGESPFPEKSLARTGVSP